MASIALTARSLAGLDTGLFGTLAAADQQTTFISATLMAVAVTMGTPTIALRDITCAAEPKLSSTR